MPQSENTQHHLEFALMLKRLHQSASLSVYVSKTCFSDDGSEAPGTPAPSLATSDDGTEPGNRLEILLLDYKHFKAARTIQRHVRGWLTRRHLRSEDLYATTIARWWRGFWVRRSRYAMIQSMLQRRIMKYYNDSATKIQSLFRGWQTRKNYQDFQGMHSLRLQYAEDMLSSLAIALYKMRKHNVLPGIYALRESDLLAKIEDLSTTFGYRFHNGRVRAAIAQKRAQISTRRKDFLEAVLFTLAPFPGPNTDFQRQEFNLPKTIGTRLQRLVLMFDKSLRDRHVKKVYMNYSARRRNSMAVMRENVKSRFCREFVRRMLRVNLPQRGTYQNIGSIQQFIDDLLTAAEEYNCYCKPRKTEEDWCS